MATHLLHLLMSSLLLALILMENNHYFASSATTVSCIPKESDALLDFKKGLVDDYDLLSSWVAKNEDCCSWYGITCNNLTGHIVELDLHGDIFDFSSRLGGELRPSLFALRHLQHLDLSSNDFYGLRALSSPQHGNLSHLSSLKYLNLNFLQLDNKAQLLQTLNMMSSIIELHLSYCGINNTHVSVPLLNFTSLSILDLSHNHINSNIPSWLFNISKLTYLDLHFNGLHGYIPSTIQNLASLKFLDLSDNDFEPDDVIMSTSLGKLCSLETLSFQSLHISPDLSSNISRDLSKLHQIFSGCIRNNLRILHLVGMGFKGQLPDWLWDLRKLESLSLSTNAISGSIPGSIGRLHSLRSLDFSNNMLRGTIPEGLWKLAELQSLNLSYNNLNGTLSESHFINVTSLTGLGFSANSLTFKIENGWLPPFQLESISLESCNLGPQFPVWLKTQEKATLINIASNGIVGSWPEWFSSSFPELYYVDMSGNQLSGKIPSSLHQLQNLLMLDLSNNRFGGEIPFSLCQLQNLMFLDLSSNHLFGKLPDCWNCSFLKFLNLNNNSFSGELPTALRYLQELIVIDLGNNQLTGEIPSWIGENLSDLGVLKLRSNLFRGHIPPNISNATMLHILDLAGNKLSGVIPKCLGNFHYMAKYDGESWSTYYLSWLNGLTNENTILIIKGTPLSYNFIRSSHVKLLDVSDNNLTGEIPMELTRLDGLISLNLSRNHLTGMIPKEINNMKELQSLDLSINNLSGRIPSGITALTYLSALNLSYNDLSGEIPQGYQMQTLDDASIYEGNPKLCGFLLNITCNKEITGQDARTAEDQSEMIWLYIGMISGFVVGFWVVWGTLLVKKSWKNCYFRFIDSIFDAVYVAIMVKISIIKRRVSSNIA